MPEHGRKQPIRIARIDGERRDLLAVAQAEMGPGLAGVDRLVNPVAYREVGAQQTLPAGDVDDIRIGRRDGDGPDRLRGLVVEDGPPRAAVVVRLPHPAVDLADVEDVRLARHAGARARSPAAKRPDQAPAHFLIQRLGVLLRLGSVHKDESANSREHDERKAKNSDHRDPREIPGLGNPLAPIPSPARGRGESWLEFTADSDIPSPLAGEGGAHRRVRGLNSLLKARSPGTRAEQSWRGCGARPSMYARPQSRYRRAGLLAI